MDVFVVAANAKGIPYDLWWLIWAVLAFGVGPILVVRAWSSRRGMVLAILPVPMALAFVLLSIASSCHSFGLYAPRGCDPSDAVWTGWVAVAAAIGAFIWAGWMLRHDDPGPRSDHGSDGGRWGVDGRSDGKRGSGARGGR